MTTVNSIDTALARLESALVTVERIFLQIRQDEAAALAARARADDMRAERNALAAELKTARAETEQLAKDRDQTMSLIAGATAKVNAVLASSTDPDQG